MIRDPHFQRIASTAFAPFVPGSGTRFPVEAFWNIISCIRAKRSHAGDLEILTLPEPHKLNQSSYTILRRMETLRSEAAGPSA